VKAASTGPVKSSDSIWSLEADCLIEPSVQETLLNLEPSLQEVAQAGALPEAPAVYGKQASVKRPF